MKSQGDGEDEASKRFKKAMKPFSYKATCVVWERRRIVLRCRKEECHVMPQLPAFSKCASCLDNSMVSK